jgi:phosphopentomutase
MLQCDAVQAITEAAISYDICTEHCSAWQAQSGKRLLLVLSVQGAGAANNMRRVHLQDVHALQHILPSYSPAKLRNMLLMGCVSLKRSLHWVACSTSAAPHQRRRPRTQQRCQQMTEQSHGRTNLAGR